MNPCNYAWNIELLAFGRNTEMEFNKYRGTEFSKTEDILEITGSIPKCYGCSLLGFAISGEFIEELNLSYAGFYSTTESINTIADIEFAHSGGFGFQLYFKWE